MINCNFDQVNCFKAICVFYSWLLLFLAMSNSGKDNEDLAEGLGLPDGLKKQDPGKSAAEENVADGSVQVNSSNKRSRGPEDCLNYESEEEEEEEFTPYTQEFLTKSEPEQIFAKKSVAKRSSNLGKGSSAKKARVKGGAKKSKGKCFYYL